MFKVIKSLGKTLYKLLKPIDRIETWLTFGESMSEKDYELEIVESYRLLGEPRYRVKVKGTNLVINVHALSEDEALEKAKKIVNDLLKGSPERAEELL